MKHKLFILGVLCFSSFVIATYNGDESLSYLDLLDQVEFDLAGLGFVPENERSEALAEIATNRSEALNLIVMELGFLSELEKAEAVSRLYDIYLKLNGQKPDATSINLSVRDKFRSLQDAGFGSL